MEDDVLILAGAIVSMIVGSIWYGPLFGKKWMEICGVTEMDLDKRKEMQKAAMPLYATQFLLTLLQLIVLIIILNLTYLNTEINISYTSCLASDGDVSPAKCAVAVNGSLFLTFILWLGFVMPTIAGSAMWNNDPTKVKWARFLIQSGYQFVMFLIFGFMIMMWM